MAGFALVADLHSPFTAQDHVFKAFKESVASFKQLDTDCFDVSGQQCAATKFDTSSSLHRGITFDEHTGSWMIAVGTVLDSERESNDGDLQTLLTDYLKIGKAAFQSLDGAFALVVYNKPANKLAIVSDPLGLVSVFHAQRGRRIYVATSALAVAKVVQATPSEYGTYLFLTRGNVYGKFTLWEEVERLSAGMVLEITDATATESVYWSPVVKDEVAKLSKTDTIDYSLDLLSWLLERYVKREGRIWADLTGGFDSRLVSALMYHCGLPFKAICEGPSDAPDVRISSNIVKELSWPYKHNMLPNNWGQERYERLPEALGKGDGHLDIFKTSGVLRDQDLRIEEMVSSIWGLAGELWRGSMWAQEFWNVGRTSTVHYDRLFDYTNKPTDKYKIFNDYSRFEWIREEGKSLFKSVGEHYTGYPNTVKLDYIFIYMNTGHTGGHVSAVMGKQRVFCPLYFKDAVTGAISTNFRWRNQSLLVRLMLEKINPTLANIETTSGGPALSVRATNMHKFIPYWFELGRKLVRKKSPNFLGKSLFPEARGAAASYPLTRWRRETLDCLKQDKVLDHTHMHSGQLYNAVRLSNFLKHARREEFIEETFLSRIVTVEMALRSVGASF